MKKYVFTCFIFFICACNNNQGTNINQEASTSIEPENVTLPEPSVEGKDSTRFKLTQLSAVTEKFLKINDNIVFTDLNEQIKSNQFLKDIQLKVKSHCIINRGTVLIQEFTRAISQSIPIIELLPTKALSQITASPPSCGFSFKAEHKDGSAHHFELPPLPITDYSAKRFIQIREASSEIDNLFPYVMMESLMNYSIDLGEQEPMDSLKLICDHFSLSRSFSPQNFISLSTFPFSDLKENVKKKIQNKKPQQQCRIFGYRNNTLVGVSSFFHIFYPQPSLDVYIEDEVLSDEEKNSFYHIIMNVEGLPKTRPLVSIYSYKISNLHSYPVHILIEDYEDIELKLYGLYYGSKEEKGFYNVHSSLFHLSNIKTSGGKVTQKKIDDGILITLGSYSAIEIYVALEKDFELCHSQNDDPTWIGGVMLYPDLKIYQLISNQTELIPFEKNIQYQLNTFPGNQFQFITNRVHTTFERQRNRTNHLWFRDGHCNGKITDTPYPIIEVYGQDRKLRVRFTDSTPVQQHQYDESDTAIRFMFGKFIRGI